MGARLETNTARALYLYGITREAASPKLPGVDGLSPLEALPCGGMICWISRVSRREFADQLAGNMENLEWLAAASVRHQRIVAAIADETSVLPARFGTVFLSEASLRAHVQKRKRALEADFKRVQGADEWGVKVFSLPPKISLPAVQPRTGKDYLKAKAALRKGRPAKRPQGHDPQLQAFARQLKELALATADGGTISSAQRDLEWQSSFLLKRADRSRFEALLKVFSQQWGDSRRIEATGPWPPYSFVSKGSS